MDKKSYHKFVFDEDKKEFVGEFDEMYKEENIDPWHCSDLTAIAKKFIRLFSPIRIGTISWIMVVEKALSLILLKKIIIEWLGLMYHKMQSKRRLICMDTL